VVPSTCAAAAPTAVVVAATRATQDKKPRGVCARPLGSTGGAADKPERIARYGSSAAVAAVVTELDRNFVANSIVVVARTTT
jgi:thymidine phosphorylase